MKKLSIALLYLIFNFTIVNAQTYLWGVSTQHDSFVIFKTEPDSTETEIVYSFVPDKGGSTNHVQLCEPEKGILYGVTSSEFSNGSDLIFRYDIKNQKYEVKADLSTLNASKPLGGLMKASNGKLYGTTSEGGLDGMGVLFEYDYLTDKLTKKLDFFYSLGIKPIGRLVEGANANLYGVTSEGATGDHGALFIYNLNTDTVIQAVNFGIYNGSAPRAGLTMGLDGKLYGTTTSEGKNGSGTIFSFDISKDVFEVKHDFLFFEHSNSKPLLEISNGKFLGVLQGLGVDGNGIIFEYNSLIGSYSTKLEFQDTLIGKKPISSLALGPNGKLYGTNAEKESSHYGLIYETNQSFDTLDIKHTFYKDGYEPSGDMFLASNGKLYGFTATNENLGRGSLYEFDPVNGTVAHRVRFGLNPLGHSFSLDESLVKGENGKLYGKTLLGGAYNAGTVFELDSKTKQAIKLFDLKNFNNKKSIDSLIMSLNTYSPIYNTGKLIEGDENSFYSVNHSSGSSGIGEVIKYNYQTKKSKVIYEVPSSANKFYLPSLFQANNKKLYGINIYNQLIEISDQGSHKLLKNLKKSSYVTHHSFVQMSNDKLYASSYDGGINKEGDIYSYDIIADSLTVLHTFDGVSSSNLKGSNSLNTFLVVDDENLMGVADGGKNDNGILYFYNVVSDTFIKKIDFDDYNLTNSTSKIILHPNSKVYGASADKLFEYDSLTNKITRTLSLPVDFGDVQLLNSFCFSDTITPNLATLPDVIKECRLDSLAAYKATNTCGDVIIGEPNQKFPITKQGITNLTWLYEDLDGNRMTQNQKIIIKDISPPSPLNLTLDTLYEDCPLETLNGLKGTDNCTGSVTATSNLKFPLNTLGEHTIIWTYDDGNGNTTIQKQILILRDITAPVVDMNSLPDITAHNFLSNLTPPTATDACAGTVSGITKTQLPITKIGETIITWEYNDGNNNLISIQTQKVIILDKLPPVPMVSKLPNLNSSCSITTLSSPKAQDANIGLVNGTHKLSLPITKQGNTKIVWTFDDGLGNTSTQEQIINIKDEEKPIPEDLNLPDLHSTCSITNLKAPLALDNCKGRIIGVPNVSLPISSKGKTDIIWTYNDGNGNTSTQKQSVYITSINDKITQSGNKLIVKSDYDTYQWLDCTDGNNEILEATNNTFSALKTGSYAVRITDNECQTTSKCFDFQVLSRTSRSSVDDLIISPNPTSAYVYVNQGNYSNRLRIKVYNSFGTLILKLKSKTQITKLDLRKFQKGIYMVVVDDGNKVSSHKIIKE